MLLSVILVAECYHTVAIGSSGFASALPAPGNPIATDAKPIWLSEAQQTNNSFALFRREFRIANSSSGTALSAAVIITAAASPLCAPPCLPHGGTSAPKLLGAYKLFINGVLAAVGPGRNLNSTQATDIVDVSPLVRSGGAMNALAVQCYHTTKYGVGDLATPRLLVELDVWDSASGATMARVLSGVDDGEARWTAAGADSLFKPTGQTGNYGQPHEYLDMRVFEPLGDWLLPGWTPRTGGGSLLWSTPVLQPAFEAPLARKFAEPLALLWRPAQALHEFAPAPTPAPASPCVSHVDEGTGTASLACTQPQQRIASVTFAHYGTPSGACAAGAGDEDTLAANATCDEDVSKTLADLCVGKSACHVQVSNEAFGGTDPCHRTHKWLSAHVVCEDVSASTLSRASKSDTLYHYLVDMGTEMQGGLNISIDGGAVDGAVVTIRLGESLNEDGTVKVPMYTGNVFEDHWTLRAGRQQVSQHEYMEFRWAELIGVPAPLALDDVSAWVVRYPLANADNGEPAAVGDALSQRFATKYGNVHASNEPDALWPATRLAILNSSDTALDRVWGFTRYTVLATSLDLNTDSNTRQRDLCHIDAFIATAGQFAVSNATGVQLHTVLDALQPDSNIWASSADFKAMCPMLVKEALLGDHRGSDAALRIAREHYTLLKDFSLRALVSAGDGLLHKQPTMGCPSGIFETPTPKGYSCALNSLIDWPASQRDGYEDSEVGTVSNAYVAGAIDALADIAGWLADAGADTSTMFGMHTKKPSASPTTDYAADAAALRATSARLKDAMRGVMYDEVHGQFRDGAGVAHSAMHSSLFAAAFGVVGSNATMAARVTDALRAASTPRLRCSCMAAFWLLQGLYSMGRVYAPAADLAYQILTADANHTSTSWLAMIDTHGATATMEAWSPEDKPNLSFSHPWCSAPNSLIPRGMLGVRATAPQWARFEVVPQLSTIVALDAVLPNPMGAVDVRVQQSAGRVELWLVVPFGAQARVCLPSAHPSLCPSAIAIATGAPTLVVNGMAVEAVADGRMLCAPQLLLAGQHNVVRTDTDC